MGLCLYASCLRVFAVSWSAKVEDTTELTALTGEFVFACLQPFGWTDIPVCLQPVAGQNFSPLDLPLFFLDQSGRACLITRESRTALQTSVSRACRRREGYPLGPILLNF